MREDYSPDGESWRSFPHAHARSRAYRWGEDGLLGWTDRKCRLGFSIALWNGQDTSLKERLFGLTNPEGNHGEDVKELYYYLDATPTHSFCRALYKYPLEAFPYDQLRSVNASRGYNDPEFEILDTDAFTGDRYVDVLIDYAKVTPNDTLVRVQVTNRWRKRARIALLGQFVFRNTWRWGCTHEGCTPRPQMRYEPDNDRVDTFHTELGKFSFATAGPDPHEWLFTENETNYKLLYDVDNITPYVKNAFHDYVVKDKQQAVNPERKGTKCGGLHWVSLKGGETKEIWFRLGPTEDFPAAPLDESARAIVDTRQIEADEFYANRFEFDSPASRKHQRPDRNTNQPAATLNFDSRADANASDLPVDERAKVHRQAIAGLLWTKQFYHYSVFDWLQGDPDTTKPPAGRGLIRNGEWGNVFCRDVLSMPDKWEYPWFAAWDSAFHMIPFADIDPRFTREQLLLFLREWYQHPNGQLPAYEFNYSDVNPPVHAWACMHVYRQSQASGSPDLDFLEQAFHKLLINFTWWVNRKDPQGNNIFGGGFLGLDNIGPFDRSHPPEGMTDLEQADGTAWMAFNCGVMLDIALELARQRGAYGGIASKFFEHFMMIADAMNHLGGSGLWNDEDGFYYDMLRCGDHSQPLAIRSIVGVIPICAAVIVEDRLAESLAGFRKRTKWFMNNRHDIMQRISWTGEKGGDRQHLLAIPTEDQLRRVLQYVFDEEEFLSPFGIRSLSKAHQSKPFEMTFGGETHRVAYLPAESDSWLFGGNSNWRGPIWMPINFLLIESLRTYDRFYGESFKIEVPTRSGNQMTLGQAADELARRLTTLFLPGSVGSVDGGRPCHGDEKRYRDDPAYRDLVLFYEYFHADTGRGCGASHQTGWTALVASLLARRK